MIKVEMASAGKIQPVRISELMGLTKSDGKAPASERNKMEPVRVTQLLESFSRSCSRTIDAASRPTFVIPCRGVRRKLYDPVPSPDAPRQSILPSRPPKRNAANPRASLLPQKRPQNPRQTAAKPPRVSSAPSTAKPPSKPRKSFLLPPNTIMKNHIEKTIMESSVLETSTHPIEEEQPVKQLPRPTVIISLESSKEPPKIDDQPPAELNGTFTKDSDEDVDLEKSLENKENIPPPPESLVRPLSEQIIPKLPPITPDMFQETLKRLEKIEIDMEQMKICQNKILAGIEKIFESVTSNSHLPMLTINNNEDNGVDKENINSSSRKRRSRNSTGERRRSARLANKYNDIGDSFSKLEDELDIKHCGKATKVITPGRKTPVNDQFLRRKCKSERAMREYLAIKASMSYLETPDAGRFKKIQDSTPSGKNDMRRSISRKVFDELQDLYSEEDDISNKKKL